MALSGSSPTGGPPIPDHTWLIIPVHNRKDVTVGCLKELRETQPWDDMEVVVIDDGSTDGTSEAVEAEFPDVHLLHGNGSLWWGGSTRKGMQYALEHEGEIIVWMNDDVRPDPGAVAKLASAVRGRSNWVLSGLVRPDDEIEYMVTVDGQRHGYTTRWRRSRFGITPVEYEPEKDLQPADALSGKFTAMHRNVVESIGLPDVEHFPHNDCDFEYTYRAKENGFGVAVYSNATAQDVDAEPYPPRISPRISLKTALKDAVFPGRRTGNSIVEQYRRDRRFVNSSLPMILLVSAANVGKILTALILKAVLTLLSSKHTYSESSD